MNRSHSQHLWSCNRNRLSLGLRVTWLTSRHASTADWEWNEKRKEREKSEFRRRFKNKIWKHFQAEIPMMLLPLYFSFSFNSFMIGQEKMRLHSTSALPGAWVLFWQLQFYSIFLFPFPVLSHYHRLSHFHNMGLKFLFLISISVILIFRFFHSPLWCSWFCLSSVFACCFYLHLFYVYTLLISLIFLSVIIFSWI